MTPEDYARWFRGLRDLTEAQAEQVIAVAMRQIGGTGDMAGCVKARALQRELVKVLNTGWPNEPQCAMALRSIREDITGRLDLAPEGVPTW